MLAQPLGEAGRVDAGVGGVIHSDTAADGATAGLGQRRRNRADRGFPDVTSSPPFTTS